MNIEIPDTLIADAVRAVLLQRDVYGRHSGPIADAASRAVSAILGEVQAAIETALHDALLRPGTAEALRAACLEGACEAARTKGVAAVRRGAKLDPAQVALWMQSPPDMEKT